MGSGVVRTRKLLLMMLLALLWCPALQAQCLEGCDAYKEVYPPPNLKGRPSYRDVYEQCGKADDEVGRKIAASFRILTLNEERHGGKLTYMEAQTMRQMIERETYATRRQLREAGRRKDANGCVEMRDKAVGRVNEILRIGLGE